MQSKTVQSKAEKAVKYFLAIYMLQSVSLCSPILFANCNGLRYANKVSKKVYNLYLNIAAETESAGMLKE